MKNHRASFLLGNDTSHTYLSSKRNAASRNRLRKRLRRNGDNAIYVYASNVGDYGGKHPVNPRLGMAEVRKWPPLLQQLNSAGLRPIMWFFADDSPNISRRPIAQLANYVRSVIQVVDPYVIGYVPALEADEHLSHAKTRVLVNAIRSASRKPIGIHTRSNFEKNPARLKAWANLGDEWFHQYGFGLSVAQITAESRRVRSILGRSFVACEYAIKSESSQAKKMGNAALASGAHSTGNGASRRPVGPPTAPPGPGPSVPQGGPRLSRQRTVELLQDVKRRGIRPIAMDAAIWYIRNCQ